MRPRQLLLASLLLVLLQAAPSFAGCFGFGFRGRIFNCRPSFCYRPVCYTPVYRPCYYPTYYRCYTPCYPRCYYPRVYYYRPVVRYYSYWHCGTSQPAVYGTGQLAQSSPTYSSRDLMPPTYSGMVPTRSDSPGATETPASRVFRTASFSTADKNEAVRSVAPEYAFENRSASALMALGDEGFRNEQYEQALTYYSSAARRGTNLAQANFRQGHALVALGRYDMAAVAFKLGIEENENVVRNGFTLQNVYGSSDSKEAHLEKLCNAAIATPDDSELFFLVGVFLHHDEQPDRAKKFFAQAAELTDDADYLNGFLKTDQDLLAVSTN